MRYMESGQTVARMNLAVSRGQDKTDWFNCEAWDVVAQLAGQHLAKGQQVQVQGRLKMDTWQDRQTGQQRSAVKVTVSRFDFVEAYSPSGNGGGGAGGGGGSASGGFSAAPPPPPKEVRQVPTFGGSAGSAGPGGAAAGAPGGGFTPSPQPPLSPEARWTQFFAQPTQYWDNRDNKRNPRAPDFKHKDSGEALWIDSRDTPPWVADSLRQLDGAGGGGDFQSSSAGSPAPPSGGGAPPAEPEAKSAEDIPF